MMACPASSHLNYKLESLDITKMSLNPSSLCTPASGVGPTSDNASRLTSSTGSNSADDLNTQLPWKIGPITDKGLGLVVTRPVSSGSSILTEPPLLTCPMLTADPDYIERTLRQESSALPPDSRDFFLHVLTDVFRDPAHPLVGRIRTNALPCGRNGSHGAVYRNISLANHSCVPNAEYYWDTRAKQGIIYALYDLSPGDEICITYVEMLPHKQRQQKLKACFDFVCRCPLCAMSKKRRREEDKRIREMAVLQAQVFSEPRELGHDVEAAMRKFQRLAVLYEESEVDYERDLARLWAAVADLCVANCEPEQAVEKVVRFTGLEVEEAIEVVTAWYAEYEDEM